MSKRKLFRVPTNRIGRSLFSTVLLAMLAILLGIGIEGARADWLVTQKGELIVTDGAWKVEGRNVVFIAGSPTTVMEISRQGHSLPVLTMPVGTLLVLPVSEIDLPRSEKETALRSGQELAETQSRIDPVARKASRSSVPTIREMAPPGEFLEAREDWEESRFSPVPLELQVSLDGSSSDNYFRAPDDRPQAEVRATTTAGRLTWKWNRKKPLKSYLMFGQTLYDEFPSTTSYGAGLRYEGRRHSFDVSARFSRNRRALDLDETFEAADMFLNQAVYALRSKRWEWRLIGQFIDQEFDETSRNDGRFYIGQTSLLYRGFGRKFAPEIGTAWARRDAVTESQNYAEQDIYLKLRFSPIRLLAFQASVRDRYRSYDTPDPLSSNFGRQDTRRRWTLRSRVLITRKVAWQLTYSRQEGDSTREGRAFTSNDFSSGISLKLGSASGVRQPSTRGRSATLKAAPELPAAKSLDADKPAEPQGTLTSSLSLSDHLTLVPKAPLRAPQAAPHGPVSAVETSPNPPGEVIVNAKDATSILRLEDHTRGSDTVIKIIADGRLRYSTFSMLEPARLIVDLVGVVSDSPLTVPIGNGVVTGVRTEKIQTGPEPIVRVVFDLECSVQRELRQDVNSLTVRLRAADG